MRPKEPFETRLRLTYQNERVAKAIYDSVRPDNIFLPRGLKIRGSLKGSYVEFKVICQKSLESLQATLDDLLACIQAAERALGALGEGEEG